MKLFIFVFLRAVMLRHPDEFDSAPNQNISILFRAKLLFPSPASFASKVDLRATSFVFSSCQFVDRPLYFLENLNDPRSRTT